MCRKHSALVRKSRSLFRHSSAISSDEHTCWIFSSLGPVAGRNMFLSIGSPGWILFCHSVQSRHQHRRKSEIGNWSSGRGSALPTRRALGL